MRSARSSSRWKRAIPSNRPSNRTSERTRPPGAVTFDYWNTLCEAGGRPDEFRVAAVRDALREHGVEMAAGSGGADAVERACAAVRVEHDQAWRQNRQFVLADAGRSLLRALEGDIPADPTLHRRVIAAYEVAVDEVVFELVEGVADALHVLRDAGVPIGIVCDVGLAPSSVLVANLERHGVAECFAHWSFSDTVGVYKPDRMIFEHALAGLGVEDPAGAWHVGDLRRTDVAGARASGMGTVRVAIAYDDHAGDGPEADAVITGYPQLPGVLGLL